MKKLLKRDYFFYILYLATAILGIWLLSNLWVPKGFVISGHDSGLSLDAAQFVKTRLFAWDDRMGFGSDNSPHFGSIVFHTIDYALSFFANTQFAGNQLAVFFWMSMLFTFSGIFAWSLKEKLGKVFAYLFPFFMVFNFFIYQSIFILERAKYELVCVTLLFLTLGLKILFEANKFKFSLKKIFGYSIIFSIVASIFNGGSWMGLPLYGGLLVAGCVYIFVALIVSFKEKNFISLGKAISFGSMSLLFFLLLNMYSIMPFYSTIVASDYAKVVGSDTIAGGKAWLDYLSRGTFFINLFRYQGVPEWYLTGGFPNPDYSYATLYLTNSFLIFVSFLLPVISLLGIFGAKEKEEKYLIVFFMILLLVSMFFTAGTNSPIGFVYNFLYERVPGFAIFRSPYYKFASAYTLSFSVLLAFSLSKFLQTIMSRVKLNYVISAFFYVVLIVVGWFLYNKIIFNKSNLFNWQPDKSTLVQVPDYVPEFDNWLKTNDFQGRALMVPALDSYLGNDNYSWGYWSLATLPSVLFTNGTFVTNDASNNSVESGWVNTLYTLLINQNQDFLKLSSKLGINYLFVRNDFKSQSLDAKQKYSDSVAWLLKNNQIKLEKTIGQWSLYSIENASSNLFYLSNDIYSAPGDRIYLAKELATLSYGNGIWVNSESVDNNMKNLVSQQFFPLNCESCLIENLNKYADIPPVNILPNSPLYIVKKDKYEKAIEASPDDNSKLGTYIGLVLTKFSEVRSMYDLKIEKQYILQDLNDMDIYLQKMKDIVSKSASLKNSFYFVERVYETVNPIQKYMRDYVTSSDFNSEKPEIKNEILDVLWQMQELKGQYGDLVGGGEKWNFEKEYSLALPESGQYKFMMDLTSFPSNGNGGYILPAKIFMDSTQNLSITNVLNNRWMFTGSLDLQNNSNFYMNFSSFPNLFEPSNSEVLAFPLGQKGCMTGGIKDFNKNHSYVLRINSTGFSGNTRLYIVENSQKSDANQFLRGDIETDVSLNPDGDTYKYFYAPILGANNPKIYLCSPDPTIPDNIEINIREIFNPSIYVVKTNSVNVNTAKIEVNKVNPTRYNIKTSKLNGNMVLAFNETFSPLWQLSEKDGSKVDNHFMIDGYANGWLLTGGKSYDLILSYKPQSLFIKGLGVSMVTLILLTISGLLLFKKRKNDK